MASVWKGEGFDPDEVMAELDALPFIPMDEKLAGLSLAARQAGDELVDRNLAAVRHAVGGVSLDEPACALCLVGPHDDVVEAEEEVRGADCPGPLTVDAVGLLTPAWRPRLAAQLSPETGPWIGLEYPEIIDIDLRGPEVWKLEDTVAAEVEALLGGPPPPGRDTPEAEIDHYFWPRSWILGELARALNDVPPLSDVTDDFVAFYQGHDFDPYPHDLVAIIGKPEAVAALRRQGLLEVEGR